MPLVPSEGRIAKNALLSRVSELGIGVNKARGFLASLVDRGMLFEWHIPRPGTNPEVRIARQEQPQAAIETCMRNLPPPFPGSPEVTTANYAARNHE